MEAFDILRRKLSVYPKDKKMVLFFDEFPWFDTQKSDFPSAKKYVFQPDFESGSSWGFVQKTRRLINATSYNLNSVYLILYIILN